MSYPYQPPQKHFKKWVRYLSWQWYQLQNLEGFSIHYLFGVAFDWFMCLPKKANNLQVLLKKRIYWNCKILIGLGGPFRSSIQAKLEKGGIAEGESQGTLCDHSNAVFNERFTLGRNGEGPTLVLRAMKSQTRNKGNFETFTLFNIPRRCWNCHYKNWRCI